MFTDELEVDWQAEYITVQALKEAEAKKEEAKWVEASEGKTAPKVDNGTFSLVEQVFLGTMLSGSPSAAVAQKLLPGTAYYVRFRAVNFKEGLEYEKAESLLFSFTTLGVMKPEIVPPEFFEPVPGQNLKGGATSLTTAAFQTHIESNGAETKYEFAYAPEEGGHAPAEDSPSWKAFSSGAAGAITVAEDFAILEAKITGLTPEKTYYARVRASNEVKGTVETAVEVEPFRTPTARPVVFTGDVRNVTGTSAHAGGQVVPHGSETHWRFEYSTSETGTWEIIPGAEGVISKAQAEALPEGNAVFVEGSLTGLNPSTVYYVRVYAENEFGEGRNGYGEPVLTEKDGFTDFKTFGAPVVSTLAVHGLDGEVLRVVGSVNPNSVLTSGEQRIVVEGSPTGGTFTLTFKDQSTKPIAFDAPAQGSGSVGSELQALSTISGEASVTGPDGGPYTVYFYGRNSRVSQPPIVADASGLTPSGAAVKVTVVEQGGEGYDTHYHFEYVSQKQFEMAGGEGGFAKASPTPLVDLGSGDSPEYVGVDLPGLTPGESYRFRVVGANTSPGDPVVYGEEEVLTVPVAAVSSTEGGSGCPNEALRTGLSAHLPDCRAFEEITPFDKGGAREIFSYGTKFALQLARPGADGDHLEYEDLTVQWGSGPGSGQSPYFFSRTGSGWGMTAATAQPGAGVFRYDAKLFSPDLGEFAFEARWATSQSNLSSHVEFEAGPPGGPYSVVASVPRAQVEVEQFTGWVAASKDFSKLVLQVPDHTLLGHSTHTLAGPDLYEYSNGKLGQVNVTGPSPGVTIGSCGASIVSAPDRNLIASSRALSDDGSRVFFEAVPGTVCSEARHLYVRVNGTETVDIGAYTVDIGAYRFIAANAQGSEALLEKPGGENPGLYLYKTGSAPRFLPSSGIALGEYFVVSEDLSTVYIRGLSGGALYRYDVRGEKVLFVAWLDVDNERNYYASSPDGRYFYFIADGVGGLPAGGQEPEIPGVSPPRVTSQVWRYDSVEALVQCMSCASSFDHYEPKRSALFADFFQGGSVTASANGDYVFFDTPAALVPADVDGEEVPPGGTYSASSDVYEWRRDGVGGCSRVQGCLVLITSGHGGYLNILLGTTPTGRDVFFATNESLLPSDKDIASDIYDARVGGGFPEPVPPVECEGDACLTPFEPPNDVSPSSASFQGAGNAGTTVTEGKGKPRARGKPRCKAKGRNRCKARAKKKAGRKAGRVVGHWKRHGGRR
jgi:hypothetical protein